MGGLEMTIENNVSLEELDSFTLFRLYYDRMFCLELSDDIINMLNEIMDYHYNIVYV